MDTVLVNEIKAIMGEMSVIENELLNRHTSFHVGGPADVYVSVSNTGQLQELIKYLNRNKVPYYVIGNGSNLLVSDKGYHGVMIEIGAQLAGFTIKENRIDTMAGTTLGKVSGAACRAGLSGLEFAAGIPGSIGGAITMNAGAYGGEMKQIVKEVTVLAKDGHIKKLSCEEMQFGYRDSVIKHAPYIVLEACLSLQPGNQKEIADKMADFNKRRREKQPLEYPSAGSTFKRPEGHFAGKLIMDSGLQGLSVGGAKVSEKHCGFIINHKQATAQDIYKLIQKVQCEVEKNTGILLEPEVILLGEF